MYTIFGLYYRYYRSRGRTHLQKKSLVRPDDGLVPVDDLREGKGPAVREQHRHTAGLQGLQEPEGAQTASSRHQAEGRVLQEDLVVKSADTSTEGVTQGGL
jgi:hypothetical protein